LKEKIKLNSQSIAAKPKYLDKRLYGHKWDKFIVFVYL
jgi:hypothetical protein